MTLISLSLPTAGTVAQAGQIATDFTTIQNVINGGLDNQNFAAGLIFDPTKLMQGGAAKKQALLWNGASWSAADVPYIYDRATTTVDVANTVTETSLYTKSIVGGDMGTNRMLRLTMRGDYLHNNVAGDTMTLRVKFGGTTFWADASALAGVTGANRQPWFMTVEVSNLGVTNSQYVGGNFNAPVPNASAPTTGIGPLRVTDSSHSTTYGISSLGTVDTTTAQTLTVTAQWSAASANNSWRMRVAELELR